MFFLHYFSLYQRQWTQLYTLSRRLHFNWEIITDNFCNFQMRWRGFHHFLSVGLVHYKYSDLNFYQFLDLELLVTLNHDKRIRTSFPHQTFTNIFIAFFFNVRIIHCKGVPHILGVSLWVTLFKEAIYTAHFSTKNCWILNWIPGNGRTCISLMTNDNKDTASESGAYSLSFPLRRFVA